MIDIGMQLGDPCAADGWDADRRLRARAWHSIRTSHEPGPPSVAAVSLRDLQVWLGQLLEQCRGLAQFLHHGAVRIIGGRRG